MKFIAISDIHGNVEAVRGLRDRERNEFEAVIVAGDIGGEAATSIMEILASFACPVMYVFGNWDRQLPYGSDIGANCHHLHLRSVVCGGWAFAGFSGLPMSWGMNPIAARLRQKAERKLHSVSPDSVEYLNGLRAAGKEAERLNRSMLVETIKRSQLGADRTIVVTHERLFRTEDDLRAVPLFLFGHRHGFKSSTFKGATFVNVSALDDGNYAVIEVGGDRIQAAPFRLPNGSGRGPP